MVSLALKTRPVELAELGERLSGLRLCDARALRTMRRSLEKHGQLSALTLFIEEEQLQVLDGFKRVRAARALGWTRLLAHVDEVGGVEAKLRLAELHSGRGLSELEEGWLVRSLYREDRLTQPDIAQRMGRHKSWVWRRLMLVESLLPAVQAEVRLGLIVARAAVAVSRLPRGNQEAASAVVIRRGLTVRQTDLLIAEVLGAGEAERPALLERRLEAGASEGVARPSPLARHAQRGGLDERRCPAAARGRGAPSSSLVGHAAPHVCAGGHGATRRRAATALARAALARRGARAGDALC